MDQGKPLMATDSPLVDFDAVCQKVRAAVEPARTHAVSLHDELGDVLWLSESSMGPDEHNAVREAAEAFTSPSTGPVLAIDLGDLRSAVLVRAVNNRRAMVGVIMIIMDTRIVSQGATKFLTPKLQRVLAQFAAMRPDRGPAESPEAEPIALVRTAAPSPRPPSSSPATRPISTPPAAEKTATPRTQAAPASRAAPAPPSRTTIPPSAKTAPPPAAKTAPPPPARTESPSARTAAAPAAAPVPAAAPTIMPFAAGPRSIAAQVQQIVSRPARPPNPPRTDSPAAPSRPAIDRPAVTAVRTSTELQDKQPQRSVTPEIDRLHAELRRSPIALHVQRLVPLCKGGQLRRYEVLLRSGSEAAPTAAPHAMLKTAVDNGLGSMIDRRVLTELITWLIRHPDSCQADEVMFSVNLTVTALHDEHFIKFVELCLAKSSLPRAQIAFEVDASTALKLADKISDVAAALHHLGCPLVLDDFSLRTECFALLRLPGVRYVKLAPEMTAKMRVDKISQAAVTGVVQMARVLGMHTVAKRTETAAEQEWLTALGVDFVQSNFISPPVTIDSLLKPANPKI
jgi:EAL domain-containing protein (putative c-di-GMP-specific phosphodiesterase class I)